MKKLLTLAILGAAMFLSSCADQKSCYEIEVELMGAKIKSYYYGTQSEANTYGEALKVTDMHKVKVTKVNKAQSDCIGGKMDFDGLGK